MRSGRSFAGLAWATLLVAFGVSFGIAVPSLASADKPDADSAQRYWTTEWSFEDVDVANLTRQLGSIGIDLGVELEGNVSVQFDVGVPWTSLTDAAEYRFEGTLSSPMLVVDGLRLKDLQTSVEYQKGVATLSQLTAIVLDDQTDPNTRTIPQEISAGRIDAHATVELVPRGDVVADVSIDQLSLESLSQLIDKWLPNQSKSLPSGGEVSTQVQLRVPLDSASELDAYQLSGKARGRGVSLPDLPSADFNVATLSIQEKTLSVDDVTFTANADADQGQQIRLMGNATMTLDGLGVFEFHLSADDLPTTTAATAVLGPSLGEALFDGKVDFAIDGKGRLPSDASEPQWTMEGMIASPKLQIAGIDLGTLEHALRFTESEFSLTPRRGLEDLPNTFEIQQIQSRYAITQDAFELSNLNATVFRGEIQATASVPLDSTGILTARGSVAGLRPTIHLEKLAGWDEPITFNLSGELDWSVPINGLSRPSQHEGQAQLLLESIRVGDVEIGELGVQLAVDESAVSAAIDGELLDGSLHAQTAALMQPEDAWSDLLIRRDRTELEFDGIHVGPVLSMLQPSRSDWSGNLSGSVSIEKANGQAISLDNLPDTAVKLELKRVRYRSQLLSRSMRFAGQLTQGLMRVDSLAGDYGGGTVRVRGRVYLFDRHADFHPRADLRANIAQVAIDRGLWFLGDQAKSLSGRTSASMTIAGFGESFRVRGNVDGDELVLFGFPLGDAHSGVRINGNLPRLSWTALFPTIRSSIGGGQLDGELELSSTRRGGSGVDLQSRWRTRRVDFSRLTKQLGSSTAIAQGEITGELSLEGKSVESIDDLSGRFAFEFGETRGAGVPGLMGISRLLGPVSLTSQTFRQGEANGTVGRGAVAIDEFWLSSESVLIRADGKIFIRSGRMDLETLVATGDYQDVAADFARLARQYALRAILPAAAIIDVSDLLCDRTLVVSVRGTTSNPIVRLLPVETFREEAARFLLREGQRVILAGASAGTAESIFGK